MFRESVVAFVGLQDNGKLGQKGRVELGHYRSSSLRQGLRLLHCTPLANLLSVLSKKKKTTEQNVLYIPATNLYIYFQSSFQDHLSNSIFSFSLISMSFKSATCDISRLLDNALI